MASISPSSSPSATNATVAPPASSVTPNQFSQQQGTISEVDKSQIDKNIAQKWMFKSLGLVGSLAAILVAGGLLVWLFSTSNSIFSDLGSIKTEIKNTNITLEQLRNDKNRDIDRLQKEIDYLRQKIER